MSRGAFFVNGKPVVVGLVMRLDIAGTGIVTAVRTIHMRSNFAKQINDDTVLYLNEDKERTHKWFHVCGNSNVPLNGTQYGLIRSIAYASDGVKIPKPGSEEFYKAVAERFTFYSKCVILYW